MKRKCTWSFTLDKLLGEKISRFCREKGITRSFFIERSLLLGYFLWNKNINIKEILEEAKKQNAN